VREVTCVLVFMAAITLSPGHGPGCGGCQGNVGATVASGGGCSGTLSIAVGIDSGTCRYLATIDPPSVECKQTEQCQPTVTVSWSGMPAHTPIRICMTVQGVTWCQTHDSGSGTGSIPATNSPPMNCKGDSNPVTFTASAPECGTISVSTTVTCSECEG